MFDLLMVFFTKLKMFEVQFAHMCWEYKAFIIQAPFVLLALLYAYKHYAQKQHVSVRQLIQWFVVLTTLTFVWVKTFYTLSVVGRAVRAQYLFPQDSWSYILMQSMLCNFGLFIGYFLMFVTRFAFARCVQGRNVAVSVFFDEQLRPMSVYRVVWFVVWMNVWLYIVSTNHWLY